MTATMTTLLGTIFSVLTTIGLVSWVYKVLIKIIEEVRLENSNLKQEIEKLKQSESRWFQRYYSLVNIIQKNKHCRDGQSCRAYEAYIEKAEKDGII